ncbi:Txe/YoeB family addiction module toxin [Proteus cibi]|uniref:Txe/YoeB family addiction module toxin n=1 Tax=Proteus cibi TaxID=2050966 RepID=UPI0035A6E397
MDKKITKRINKLIKDIKRTLFSEIGKPEPLKHNLTVFWSRRITDEHRLIYRVTDPAVEIASCRYYYYPPYLYPI